MQNRDSTLEKINEKLKELTEPEKSSEKLLEEVFDKIVNPQSSQDTVNVHSPDIDGCILNIKLINMILSHPKLIHLQPIGTKKRLSHVDFKYVKDHIAKCNEPFLNYLKSKSHDKHKNILMLGSTRQTAHRDQKNHLCSAFSIMEEISNYLKTNDANRDWSYDSYLVGEEPVSRCEKKLWLVYAQIHRTASEYPDKNISYDFYDDRDDILSALKDFYSTHPNLIPKNVTIHIHKYSDECPTPSLRQSIHGKGQPDKNYDQTIRDKLIIKSFDKWNKESDLNKQNFEDKFIEGRKKKLDQSSQDEPNKKSKDQVTEEKSKEAFSTSSSTKEISVQLGMKDISHITHEMSTLKVDPTESSSSQLTSHSSSSTSMQTLSSMENSSTLLTSDSSGPS